MSNNEAGGPLVSGAVQSVDRALYILEFLAQHGDLGVTEIAAELGVHKSTAFRLLATLQSHDLVEQVSERGKFRLGVGVLRLAGATTIRLDLITESRPVTTALAQTVGETVNITVLSGTEALYLDQVTGPSALAMHNWLGQRIPLHATSNGKVLLAYAPPALFGEIPRPLARLTTHTVTDERTLRAELDEVRRRGWAVAVNELEEGLTAIAAPVRGANGSVVASLSASGPSFRLTRERVPEVTEKVMAAARDISRRLGWHGATHPR